MRDVYKKLLKKRKRKYDKMKAMEELDKLYPIKTKKKKFDFSTTTKQLTFFLLINFTVIEIYAMVVMVVFKDLSALTTLISAICGKVIAYLIYSCKSYFETRRSEIEKRLNKRYETTLSLKNSEEEE